MRLGCQSSATSPGSQHRVAATHRNGVPRRVSLHHRGRFRGFSRAITAGQGSLPELTEMSLTLKHKVGTFRGLFL